MDGTPVSARDLVKKLWEEADSGNGNGSPSKALAAYQPLQHREELGYLNHHYVLPDAYQAVGEATPRLRRVIKRVVGRVVFGTFRKYLEEERDFLISLVRFQNDVANSVDQLSAEVRELSEITKGFHRLGEHTEVLHQLLERRIEQLEQRVEKSR